MIPQTDTANTNNWLEASRDSIILSYIENYMSTLSLQGRPLDEVEDYDEIERVTIPYGSEFAANAEAQLGMEFQAWDDLSDEALMNFETPLG